MACVTLGQIGFSWVMPTPIANSQLMPSSGLSLCEHIRVSVLVISSS